VSADLRVNDDLFIPGAELEWTAVRSGGPGGQNVNKVSTKVELRFDVSGSTVLSVAVRARLVARARGRLDSSGRIVITADDTRSQSRNLELARERLAALIASAIPAPKARKKTKPSRASKARRVNEKRQTGEKKRTRRTGGWE
jgi:ribosome-associated protein